MAPFRSLYPTHVTHGKCHRVQIDTISTHVCVDVEMAPIPQLQSSRGFAVLNFPTASDDRLTVCGRALLPLTWAELR